MFISLTEFKYCRSQKSDREDVEGVEGSGSCDITHLDSRHIFWRM
jgi:hypothetical protein